MPYTLSLLTLVFLSVDEFQLPVLALQERFDQSRALTSAMVVMADPCVCTALIGISLRDDRAQGRKPRRARPPLTYHLEASRVASHQYCIVCVLY